MNKDSYMPNVMTKVSVEHLWEAQLHRMIFELAEVVLPNYFYRARRREERQNTLTVPLRHGSTVEKT